MRKLALILVFLLALPGVAGAALSDGLILYLKMNDGSGTDAVDSSGNGYTFALTNTPTWTTGKLDGGLGFAAASSEYGSSTAAALRTALQGENSFTVAMWAKITSTTSGIAFATQDGIGGGTSFLFYIEGTSPNGHARIRYQDPGANIITSANGTITHDTWHHVIYVSRSSTDHELYIDAASVGTSSTAASLGATIAAVELANQTTFSQFFNGDLDELAVWTRDISGSEVTELYNGGTGLDIQLAKGGHYYQRQQARLTLPRDPLVAALFRYRYPTLFQ